jgi:hypothetical protein
MAIAGLSFQNYKMKKMKTVLLAALAAYAIHTPAIAAFAYQDGNSFLASSETQQTFYVVGITDATTALKEGHICLKENISSGQLKAVAKKYLNDHPEELHLAAASLIIFSLKKAFPCK